MAARDAGLEVIYQGIRLTPEQIAAVAVEEDVDVVGLSILSGSHLDLVPQVVRLVRAGGVDAPIVAGGIILDEDRQPLLDAGVAAVYTPKDFELVRIMSDIVDPQPRPGVGDDPAGDNGASSRGWVYRTRKAFPLARRGAVGRKVDAERPMPYERFDSDHLLTAAW